MAIALALFALAFRQRQNINRTFVITMACAAIVVAVAIPPRGSHDVYSYAMYGRIAQHYGQSPYTHRPNQYVGDPLLSRVAPGWQHVHSVYGPVFTGLSAVYSSIAGTSILTTRLMYQGTGALIVIACCLGLKRRNPDSNAWLLLACNPATLLIINGGHNDLLAGGLILLAVARVASHQPLWAGVFLGAAALIKLTALLVLIGLFFYLIIRPLRQLLAFLFTTVLVTVVGYVIGGGWTALRSVLTNSDGFSRASVVSLPHHLFNDTTAKVIAVALFVTLAAYWLFRKHDRLSPAAGSLTGLNAFMFSSPYVLNWYAGWLLPLTAFDEDRRAARTGLVTSGALALAYSVPAGTTTGAIVGIVSVLALPVSLAVALVFDP